MKARKNPLLALTSALMGDVCIKRIGMGETVGAEPASTTQTA
jgi:hypothetical protein